jgi:membrane protease YdiL (CAAX protease family)
LAEPLASEPAGRTNRYRVAALGVAMALWLGCFVLVRTRGSWAAFAVVGVVLVVFAVATDARARALLRPSWADLAIGLAVGIAMVLLTHGAFELVSKLLPIAEESTRRLFTLLDVVGFSPLERAGLIVVIAACEEVIFRGALLGPPDQRGGLHAVTRHDLLRVLGFAAVYGLATATLGSALLILCAVGCGVLWGVLRVATRSVVAPIAAHVSWDLGVLVLWPLVFVGA